jgi:hypothetical protein
MYTLVKVTAVRPCMHHSGARYYQAPMACCRNVGGDNVNAGLRSCTCSWQASEGLGY